MISPLVVAEIKRLLLEKKYTHRAIAKMLGVSRGTVGNVALGRHRNLDIEPCLEPVDEEPAGPPERCPTCGGMVFMQCRLCRLQTELAKNPLLLENDQSIPYCEESTALELRPEHYARYREVRAWHERLRALGVA